MRARKLIQRFLLPSCVISLIYWFKYKCMVSPRAEVELTSRLTIGRGTEIGSFVKIKATEGHLKIGAHVAIATGCFIVAEKGGVEIGDYTMCGPNVSIVGNSYRHDRTDVPVCRQEKTSEGIRIGRDVWIGAGATVLDGCTIGDGAIIGAGSVVHQEVRPGTIMVGVPAQVVAKRPELPEDRNA